LEEPGQTHSLVQAAAILGKHRNTVASWIEKGCPVVKRADRSLGIEWQISIPAVVEWLVSRAVEDVLASYHDESGRITREEADRRSSVARAIINEVDADQKLDLVVARGDVEADMASFCVGLKTGLSNAASKIAARAAAMASAPEIQELCETELNRAFDAAQGDLVARWTEGDGDEGLGEDQPPPEG
jgi:terminase small subunit / prophage DNA-packing protein